MNSWKPTVTRGSVGDPDKLQAVVYYTLHCVNDNFEWMPCSYFNRPHRRLMMVPWPYIELEKHRFEFLPGYNPVLLDEVAEEPQTLFYHRHRMAGKTDVEIIKTWDLEPLTDLWQAELGLPVKIQWVNQPILCVACGGYEIQNYKYLAELQSEDWGVTNMRMWVGEGCNGSKITTRLGLCSSCGTRSKHLKKWKIWSNQINKDRRIVDDPILKDWWSCRSAMTQEAKKRFFSDPNQERVFRRAIKRHSRRHHLPNKTTKRLLQMLAATSALSAA